MSGVEPPSAPPPGASPPGVSPTPDEGARLWEDHADWWQREFTDGVDPEYTEQIVPLILERLAGHDRVLDVGAGEGQVSRALAAAGAQVIGVDPIQAQVEVAAARNDAAAGNGTAVEPHDTTGPRYVRAEAAALPVASGSQDAVVACLVFEHIDDVDRAIAEVARVLRPGGRFLFLLNHPLLQTPGSGWIDDQLIDPPEQYWRIGPYLPEAVTVEEVQKDVFIRFVHRPLSRYVNALADASLPIERMDEPSPPKAFLDQSPWYAAADTVPRLLALTCVKSG